VQTLGDPLHDQAGSTVHEELHPSPFARLPSSHCSVPPTCPSPQTAVQRPMLHVPEQHWAEYVQAPPVGMHWQVPIVQFPLTQSDPAAHGFPFVQGGHEPPPQSTPVSEPFLTPSVQLGTRHVLKLQTLLQQSAATLHAPPLGVHAAWQAEPAQLPLQH
jgi:hypothetical protein